MPSLQRKLVLLDDTVAILNGKQERNPRGTTATKPKTYSWESHPSPLADDATSVKVGPVKEVLRNAIMDKTTRNHNEQG